MSTPYREFYWQSHDRLRLYARVYDAARETAPTVLCLHGLTRNSRDFEDLAPHLQQRYRVIAPDLRGRGFSARDPQARNYNPGIYVQDIVKLLNVTNAGRVGLIGTSLGGIVGMLLGSSHADRIACLILNDVGPELDARGLERIKSYAGKLPAPRSWSEAIAQTQEVYGDAWRDLPLARWPVMARRSYREDSAGNVRADCDPMIGEVLRNAVGPPMNLWPQWKTLGPIPTLAIRGAHSDLLSPETFARMKFEKPDLEVLTVAGRGHVPLLDEPDCVGTVDDFLSRFMNFPLPP